MEGILSNKKAVLVIFILFACLFYLDKIILGPFAFVRIHDTFDTDYGRYKIIGDLFFKFGFFGWLPNIACGMPAYAFHYPPYYILCILSTFIPSWLLYTILVIFLMIIAGFGMYWFLKDFLDISQGLSFMGGVFFALYTQVQQNALVSTVFNYTFPAFFMCLLKAQEHKNIWLGRFVLPALIFIILLISYPVLTLPMFFVLQLLVIFLLGWRSKQQKNKLLIKTLLVWSGYILLCAPVLYQLYTFMPFSQRTYAGSVSAKLFLSIFKTNILNNFILATKHSGALFFIIGFIPLIFYSRKALRAFILALILLSIATFFSGPQMRLFSNTIFEKMDLIHFLWALPFAFTVFVIVGFQELKRFFIYRKIFIAFAVFLSLILTVQFRLRRRAEEQIPYKRHFENNSFFSTLKEKEGGIPFRVGILSDLPAVLQSYRLETVDARSPLLPKYYKGFFKEIILPHLSESDSRHFDEYWYDLILRKGPLNVNLLEMINTKYLVSQRYEPGLDNLSTEVIKTGCDNPQYPFLRHRFLKNISSFFNWDCPAFYIYKLKDAFERGYLATEAIVLPSDREVLDTLSKEPIRELKNKVYFSEEVKRKNLPGGRDNRLKIVYYSPDRIVFQGFLNSPAILAVTNNFHPNWQAAVNGIKTKIYRANFAFQAIFIDRLGKFDAVFEYEDPWLWRSHYPVILGIILICLAIFLKY